MTKSEIKALKNIVNILKNEIVKFDSLLYTSDIADKEFNMLRESHDYIANAIDNINRVIKLTPKTPIEGILAKPISECSLSVRALSICKMNDLEIVADICRLTPSEFLSLRNSGRRTFLDIDNFLKENNLEWGMEV